MLGSILIGVSIIELIRWGVKQKTFRTTVKREDAVAYDGLHYKLEEYAQKKLELLAVRLELEDLAAQSLQAKTREETLYDEIKMLEVELET